MTRQILAAEIVVEVGRGYRTVEEVSAVQKLLRTKSPLTLFTVQFTV
jgi:hypothetical protein